MKILFVCDWDYSYLWPEIAIRLKAEGVVTEADALVVGKLYYDWLKDTSNAFEGLWLLQENIENPGEHWFDLKMLRRLDKRFGCPTIWRYLWADRRWVHAEYREAVKLLNCTFAFYEKLFAESQPDVVVTNGYAAMPQLVSYAVANSLGIPVINPIQTRIADYYLATTSEKQCILELGATEVVDTELLARASDYVSTFRSRPVQPRYVKVNARNNRRKLVYGAGRFLRYSYRYFVTGAYRNDHSKSNPFLRLTNETVPVLRRAAIRTAVSWDSLDTGEDYLYFPLHVQPEASTMTLAPFYLDQPSVIENLAKSAPYGMSVVVKEHMPMMGKRPVEFYKRLQRISNVKVVAPDTDGFTLISNARAVTTLTGTAGLEGLLLGKPVITFGHAYYDVCSVVKKLGDTPPARWAGEIRAYLSSFETDDGAVEQFVAAVMKYGYEMYFGEPMGDAENILSKDNIEVITRFVANEATKAVGGIETVAVSV